MVAAVAGCKSEAKVGPTTYVTVTAPPTTSSAAASPTPAPSPRTSTAPPPPTMTKLPGDCDGLLSEDVIDAAISTDISGATAFVVGLPDTATKRVSYVNCRYGVSGQSRQLEIQVSLYQSAAAAAARIQPTVDDFTQHGASASKVVVAGIPGRILSGGTGEGYGPTVILAYGQRTVAVTFDPSAVPAAEVGKDLIALAALAVKRTSPA